jgi:hypothetical protein
VALITSGLAEPRDTLYLSNETSQLAPSLPSAGAKKMGRDGFAALGVNL